MTLPSNGNPLSFDQIRVELGIPTQAPFSLNIAEAGGYVAINTNSPNKPNQSTPNAVSEWYSYDHNATACPYTYSISNVTGIGDANATCGAGTFNTNYSNCSGTLSVGCFVYTNSNCTGTYSNSYIQDSATGLNWLTDSSGQLVSSTACT